VTNLAILYLVLVIVLTGASQVLLKVGAKNNCGNKISASYLNLYTITAYGFYVAVTFITVYALKEIPLNLFYATTSLKFILVLILSKIILGETISRNKAIASGLIAFGVAIFNI